MIESAMNTINLELAVAQALHRASTFERALHDAGPWAMGYGGLVVPAVREVQEAAVVITAEFPEQCWLVEPDPCAYLICRGVVIAHRPVDQHPGDTAFDLCWRFSIEERSRV